MMTTMTYVVADGEYVGELFRDVGMIARHERRIADNAQRHEQIDKRVHYFILLSLATLSAVL